MSNRLTLPALLVCGAVFVFYARSLLFPVVFYDDFPILAQSWTWRRTLDGLWVPQNEHAMPLGRLLCFALACLAGRPTRLPLVTCTMGPAALFVALGLVFVFVRRELGRPLYALLAVVLFGVTTVYHQAVWWFAAAFALLALDTTLLGLLAAQRWRQTGRPTALALSGLACLLAPGWFAAGVLAGPLCGLYLLAPGRGERLLDRRRLPASLVPVAGTALFLAVSLPRTARAILHLGHYGGQTAVEAFRPLTGLRYTARSLADNLLLGVFGVWEVALPGWCVAAALVAAAALAAWWWRQAADRRLMLLGLALILGGYLLVYSARAAWPYEWMVEPRFSRYHLLPQLGLALFVCGGLTGRAGGWFPPADDGAPTARQRGFACGLILACFLTQLPRGLLCAAPTGSEPWQDVREQQAALRRIERVEAACRAHHIDAAAARRVLGELDVPSSLGVMDGWEFLVGSDDPHPLPPEEVRRLLDAAREE